MITIFHFDKKTQTYTKNEYVGEFQGTQSSSASQGYTKANSVSVWLFYKNNDLDINTFSIGDILINGSYEDITKEADIKVPYYKISTLINNNYGSYSMQHIQIGAN